MRLKANVSAWALRCMGKPILRNARRGPSDQTKDINQKNPEPTVIKRMWKTKVDKVRHKKLKQGIRSSSLQKELKKEVNV
jgi:hypothetical protein